MPNIPYMTKKHFTVLADELGHDKFYYNSKIAYHEKLTRLTAYCIKSNHYFQYIASIKKPKQIQSI